MLLIHVHKPTFHMTREIVQSILTFIPNFTRNCNLESLGSFFFFFFAMLQDTATVTQCLIHLRLNLEKVEVFFSNRVFSAIH